MTGAGAPVGSAGAEVARAWPALRSLPAWRRTRWPWAPGWARSAVRPARRSAAAACRRAGRAVAWPSDPEGVGSKRSQPAPWKYSSGHAWASLVRTFQPVVPDRRAFRVPHGDPGGDIEQPGQYRHGEGELLAVALPVLGQEVDQRLGRVRLVHVQAVGELAALGEPVLQGHRLAVERVLPAGDPLGELAQRLKAPGDAEVVGRDAVGDLAGLLELLRGGGDLAADRRVAEAPRGSGPRTW